MREILFKAKRIDNGEWVEGSCVNVSNKHFYIFTGKLDISNGYLDFEKYSINPETLCQFTGLYDKNGNKIWENDIVNIDSYSYIEPEDSVCGIVRYSNAYSAYCLDCNSENGWIPMYDCAGSYTTIYHVIGSAFDNPELLKGGAE